MANSGWGAGETRASLQAFLLVQNTVTALVLGVSGVGALTLVLGNV